MYQDQMIWVANDGDEKIFIYPKMANRHGLIAGATGTGKTVTLRVLAESFSDCGVPVFLADIKGDLGPMCHAGEASGTVGSRVEELGLVNQGFAFKGYPVNFWDVYGEKGIPLRTTISEMGPLLLSRILDLNDTQAAILTVIFKIADDESLLLIDTKDLKSMIAYINEDIKEYSIRYGNMTAASLAAITRAVVALEAEGGDMFFGEPALNIREWFATNNEGRGMIQLLDCQKLVNNPRMYSSFLLWMLSEIYEILPEAGDLDRPKMVFFFDEAHMLFDSASKALLVKIEQIVKLIRSKGVGIYFITQNPKDIPDGVLAQLGNKVQHALHAYTPAEMKGAKAAAQSFRENPAFDTYEVLQELGIGEALISVLDEKGIPTVVRRANVLPPQSQLGILDDSERDSLVKNNLFYMRYSETVDNFSAYEFLNRQSQLREEEEQKAAEEEAARIQAEKEEAAAAKQAEKEEAAAQKQAEREAAAAEKARLKEEAAAQKQAEREAAAAEKARLKEEAAAAKQAEKEKNATKKAVGKAVKSTAKSAAGTVGRELGNSLGSSLGGKFGKKLGGNIGASLGRGILDTFLKF